MISFHGIPHPSKRRRSALLAAPLVLAFLLIAPSVHACFIDDEDPIEIETDITTHRMVWCDDYSCVATVFCV